MRRLALVGVALLAAGAGPAQAATNEYSTGSIDVRVAAQLDQRLTVPDAGPVSFVRVSLRITTPDTSALSISLVSPAGTEVPLVVHRGPGVDFGSGAKGCGGSLTVFDSDVTANPVAVGVTPFTDNPYAADGSLRSLYGQEAQGDWALRIATTGAPATLRCFTLDISRAVPETMSARRGSVQASVGYVERDYAFQRLRVKVVRGGRTVVDAPIERLHCPDCSTFRPIMVRVRDLDGGEPEVLIDMFSGGAHCCSVVLVLGYDPAGRTYRSQLLSFGNYGYRLADLDNDGKPEFSAFDERFVYTFTAYVFSAAPIQITQYRQGTIEDVTRSFPALIRKDAASLWALYQTGRRQKDVDLRAYLAAYVADEYLLGRSGEAKRALDLALERGDLGEGSRYLGSPSGQRFVTVLMEDLRKWGYVQP